MYLLQFNVIRRIDIMCLNDLENTIYYEPGHSVAKCEAYGYGFLLWQIRAVMAFTVLFSDVPCYMSRPGQIFSYNYKLRWAGALG